LLSSNSIPENFLGTVSAGVLNWGVAVFDGATGSGYIMYSESNVHDRTAANPLSSGFESNANHFMAVRYNAGNWEYNKNGPAWYIFTPVATDRLIASVDFTANTATLLSGETDPTASINGIAAGYLSGDINVIPEQWNGAFNAGEFDITGTSFTVADYIVGTVSATDPEFDTLTYSLSDNAGGRFAIDAITGAVSIANPALIDFETAATHTIIVDVFDGTTTTSQSFIINVNDLNEAPIAVDQTLIVESTVPDGTSAGTAAATDPDAGDVLTYSITSGNAAGVFAINSATGEITVANSALLVDGNSYNLVIHVEDDAGRVPPDFYSDRHRKAHFG
jgi:hypothetical protein